MNLAKTVRRVQYQTAKLEVIEFMFWHGKNDQPSLDTEMAYNMISTLRQSLFDASEAYLESSPNNVDLPITLLQDTVVSSTNFLTQMNSGLTSTEKQVIFLKELFTNIITELINLNTELSNFASRSESDFAVSMSDQQFKRLLNICMGDSEKAERLIQYEYQQNSALDREEAMLSAITRWESDNR